MRRESFGGGKNFSILGPLKNVCTLDWIGVESAMLQAREKLMEPQVLLAYGAEALRDLDRVETWLIDRLPS